MAWKKQEDVEEWSPFVKRPDGSTRGQIPVLPACGACQNGKDALAKESPRGLRVPFFSLSGSELLKSRRVGASRVRDYSNAQENSPA